MTGSSPETGKFVDFANTFLVQNGCGQPTLQVVGPKEATSRKKRPHRKSRTGCIRCKRRKVKCDEGDPCSNCVKRNETCVRSSPVPSQSGDDTSRASSIPREMEWTQSPDPESGTVNLLHMELLHHFEKYTVPTLAFEGVWPTMLQLAFQSQQHTYLVNAMLSLAAAHLDYLNPGNARYHRANYALLDKALHDYRQALSTPITTDNCDALLGTAILVHYLMWCDLSFMEGQTDGAGLDLSGDRLYWLSTGVRQIFFMAWPLFQTTQSVFLRVAVLQPCMVLEQLVEARGINWQRYAKDLMDLYDNPCYHGGRNGAGGSSSSSSGYGSGYASADQDSQNSWVASPISSTDSDGGAAWIRDLNESLDTCSSNINPVSVATLWESYKEGEAYVAAGGAHNEPLRRAAYKRIVSRLAVALAVSPFCTDNVSCPASSSQGGATSGLDQPSLFKKTDLVRYILTFPMMCFGPLLPLISSGDSRALVVLFHIYNVVSTMLPGDEYWWCQKRAAVMQGAIGSELKSRGLGTCLRGKDLVA